MNEILLKKLSEADGIASIENEVRSILYNEGKDFCDEVFTDILGSIVFRKKGKSVNPLKIMFCAHMDEVGFIVRHISDIGFLYVMPIGGVLDKSKEMQMVRVTTQDGHKYKGILNVTKDGEHHVKDIYVDLGLESEQEVRHLGIEEGDMVTFDSSFVKMNNDDVYAGKAMDDRSGCYVLVEALKQINMPENDLYFVATSSEEVGTRGAKTVTHMIQPDIVFVLDVANNPELIRNYSNKRKIGQGFMIVHYDKMLSPNKKLLSYVKQVARSNQLKFQNDMLSGGGTDAGLAHLEDGGCLALVLGIPLRYCHSAYSLVNKNDLAELLKLVVELTYIKYEDYIKMIQFIGG